MGVLAAFDAKEYRRGGDRRPQPLGDTAKPGGFFTQLSCGVVYSDPDAARQSFLDAMAEVRSTTGIFPFRHFGSAQAMLRGFRGDKEALAPVLESVASQVAPYVDHVRVNYPVLTPERAGVIRQGYAGGPARERSASEFLRDIGNFAPLMGAWWFSKRPEYEPVERLVVDNVQAPINTVWTETARLPELELVAAGDECCPWVAFADHIAWLTDYRLGKARLHLLPGNVKRVWDPTEFDVDVYYMGESFLHALKAADLQAAPTYTKWRRPMTYLLVDSDIVAGSEVAGFEGEPEVKLKHWIEDRGWIDHLFAYAHNQDGGAKAFNPGDRSAIEDGDTLAYVGPNSRKRAEGLADAVDVGVVPFKAIRKEEP